MKKFVIPIACLLILLGLLLAGCSSKLDKQSQRKPGEFPRNGSFGFNRSMNFTDESRQAMFQERQQQMIDACKEKEEGDTCNMPSMRGLDVEGICNFQNESLLCTTNLPTRLR